MEALQTGIVVYRASRLEALLEPLEALLAKYPPKHLLGSPTVLAAHPGMKRWLGLALARRRGPRGVVANLDLQLPTTWFDARVREELGLSAISLEPYRRESLRWRIHAVLPSIDDDTVRRYLAGNDGRRRFQLADRIAAIFSRYMVYRPQWLSHWQQGMFDVPEPNFLAPIWRRIRADIGSAHRGELIARLIERRQAAPVGTPLEPVHVFGLSHLPPSELAILRAESRHRLIVLYVPDPSIVFWAGLGNARAHLARLLALGVGDDSERELLSLGHPLLSAWGRMGHHFGLRLHEGIDDVLLETRHGEDEAREPESRRLLHRLQQDIRLSHSDLLKAETLLAVEARDDDSLRIHGCHTRVRELEVLHDAIRDALTRDPDLDPSDILVMSPMIADYAPLVPSVFGGARKEGKGLPLHLADVALRRSHDVLDAFATLLQMPVSRVSAPQVLDLLSVPAMRRAFGIDADALERLRAWLTDARVAWGLDASARERLGLPAFAEHSLGWGMDRLLGGYVFGDSVSDDVAKQVGLWPVEGVNGAEVEALGAMDRLLCQIDRICGLARSTQPLSRWRGELQALLSALFRPDLEDHAECEAMAALERTIESLKLGTSPEIDPEIDYSVLRDLLNERLDAAPERQPYLIGGITFSGMVPQRSIPFRMIALIGMNDGDFPRASSDGGIDLMTTHRQLGDRDVRSDDRYLFLETVMAARARLHISYLSEGVRDGKPRNPSAPLAELMAYLDDRAGIHGDLRETPRPWFVQHPLQPFDARYFDQSDPRLFSYERGFARMVRAASLDSGRFAAAPREHLIDDVLKSRGAGGDTEIPLRRLLDFFRRPSELLLKQRLGLRLDALERDALGDTEPLLGRFDAIDRVPRALVFDALERACFTVPEQAPDALRLSGRMPPGALGGAAYRDARDQAMTLLALAADTADLVDGLPARTTIALDQRVGDFVVQGTSASVYSRGDAWMLFDVFPGKGDSELGFKEKLPVFLEWALLRLKYPEQPVRVVLLAEPEKRATSTRWHEQLNAFDARFTRDDLGHRVERLLRLWQIAQSETAWYFPGTSWAVASAKQGKARDEGEKRWQGSDHASGERDYAPGYARVLAQGVDLFAGQDWANLQGLAEVLRDCIDFTDGDSEIDHD